MGKLLSTEVGELMSIRRTFSGKAITAVLELLVPGAGHFALGDRKQALLWFGATCVPWLCFIVAALAGSLTGFWATGILMLFARFAGVVHCFFVVEHELPLWSTVAVTTAVVGVALVGAVAITKTECVSAYRIPSDSMYPTVRLGDNIMVSRLNRRPKRGDIVAFWSPKGGSENVYVKRVVATGADTVQVSDSLLYLNDKQVTTNRKLGSCPFTAKCELLEESIEGTTYSVTLTHESSGQHDSPAVIVPPGTIFVLGDNRDNSVDSRSFGPIPVENVIGRYQFTWISLETGEQ